MSEIEQFKPSEQGRGCVERTFRVDVNIISCGNCLCNYPRYGKGAGQWCQIYSFPANTGDEKDDLKHALACDFWNPREHDRSNFQRLKPSPTCWYEKDSMG